MTSLSVHPLSPNYLSLALGDGTVCLMDRRVTGYNGAGASHQTPTLLATKACVTRFKPETLSKKPFKVTSLQFNETGSELLVNYSEDYLYLFSSCLIGCGGDINTRIGRSSSSSRYTPSRNGSRHKENTSTSAQPKSNFTPPTKRLRLRGDWSDTGPDARPENTQEREEEREGGGENESSRSGRSTFMNRMSHLFARWIDESLSSNSSNTTTVPSTGGTVNSARDGEASPVHSDDSSFQLFSDEESDEESSMSDPRTPTASLTTAMASCSTDSPHKAAPGVTSDRGGMDERREEEDGVERRRGREEAEPNKRGRGQSYTRARQVTRSGSDGLTSPLRSLAVRTLEEEEDHEVTPSTGRENTGGSSSVNDVHVGSTRARVTRGSSRIQLVEGESDSDDLQEREEERDCYSTNDEIDDEGQERDMREIKSNNHPLMKYQGHRNARTMVS